VTGYVVCAACGARMKVDRERCLRCEEPLRPAAPRIEPLRWRPLTLAQRRMAVAAAASLVVVTAILVWAMRPAPLDEAASPVPTPAVASAPSAPTQQPAVVQTAGDEPLAARARDANRTGTAAMTIGDLQTARTAYEQALAQKADDPEALNGLGLVMERLGDHAQAAARFSRAAELGPAVWAYRFNLAHAEGELQQWDKAIADYREAARVFPDDYATQYNLALALHKKGDEQAAIPEFEKAIKLAPSEPTFHISLAMSLEKVGRVADAVREYNAYMEMAPDAPEAAKLKAHIAALTAIRPQSATPASSPTS
jgi:tetratricopeptide (TPR) repeat protein